MNRRVMAARAAANGRTGRHFSPSATPVAPIRYVKRSRAVKMTGAQRNSEGRRSEWSMSPEFWTDPKWSRTVSG